MTDSYRVAPEQTIELRTLMAEPLAVLLRELTIEVEPGGCVVTASLELSGDAYARCIDEGQLGLDAPGRGPGPEPQLGRPIRVVAKLRSHLADLLARAEPDPMAALIDHMLTPPAELAHADAWRAIDVTQDDEIAAGLSMGYRTVWAGLHNLD